MDNTLTLNPFVLTPRRLSFKFRLGVKILYLFGLISIITLLTFYILQANAMTRETYLLGRYQQQLKALSQENMALEINFSQVNSLMSINDSLKDLNFEKVGQVHYLKVMEGQVAVVPLPTLPVSSP